MTESHRCYQYKVTMHFRFFFSSSQILKMKFLLFLSLSLAFFTTKVCGQNFSKTCFIKTMNGRRIIEGSIWKLLVTSEKIGPKCKADFNHTLDIIQGFTDDPCMSKVLNRNYVKSTIINKYFYTQYFDDGNVITIEKRFPNFKKLVLNVTTIMCNNQDVFAPDYKVMIKAMMLMKKTKPGDYNCLKNYLMENNKSQRCYKIGRRLEEEFYKNQTDTMRRVLGKPTKYQELVNFGCLDHRVREQGFYEFLMRRTFEQVDYMSFDKEVHRTLTRIQHYHDRATRSIFDCLIWPRYD